MDANETAYARGHLAVSLSALQAASADAEFLAIMGRVADEMAKAIGAGRKILLCGNGGSAADAQHFAAELVGRYEAGRDRRAWPVLALSADTSVMTALANDLGFAQVFARQVEAHGQPGDVALGITTSGRSPNVLAALETARARGLKTIALTGRGGDAGTFADVHIAVPEDRTPRIQEVHATVLHVLCELIEDGLKE